MVSNFLNKSRLAGTNWSILLFIPLLVATILAPIWFNPTGSVPKSIFIAIVLFFILLILFISATNKATISKIRKDLNNKGEALLNYFFAIYEVNQTNSQKIEFTDIGKYYVDVIVAMSDKGNIFIRPTLIYTKQPIIKFPINSIESISIENLEIPRPQLSDWQNSLATTRGGQGVGLPINQINKALDQYLPLDRNLVKIKTSSEVYEIAIHKKQFNSFKKIFESKTKT